MATVTATATLRLSFTNTVTPIREKNASDLGIEWRNAVVFYTEAKAQRIQTTNLVPTVQEPGRYIAIELFGNDTSMEVWRVEPGGTKVKLRGSPFPLDVTNYGVAFDYEAPFDVPVTYLGLANDIYGESDEQVTLPSYGEDWLRSIQHPSRSTPVTVQSFPEKSLAGRATLYNVIGRSVPVAVTDVLSAPTATLTVYADGNEAAGLQDLIADGYPLLFHTPPTHGEDRFYFVVTAAVWRRASRLAHDTGRILTLEVAEVDMSKQVAGISPAQYTWATLNVDYLTWADLLVDFTSWKDITLYGLDLPGV